MHDDTHYVTTHFQVLPFAPGEKLAPWWHTAAILALFGLLTIAGAHRAEELAYGTHAARYLGTLMLGWMTLGTVVAGLYHRRAFFHDTLQRNGRPWYAEAARGFGIWLLIIALLAGIQFTLRHTRFALPVDRTVVRAMAPQSWPELALWFCVSVTAGFCEEHVFRGYLLPQSIAALRRARLPRTLATILAIIVISALFGVLHLYEGVGGAIMITMLGMTYCCFALTFRNLRALIVAHFLQDFVTGSALFAHHLRHP